MHVRTRLSIYVLSAWTALLYPVAWAQETSTAEQLIHQEEVRRSIEAAFDLFRLPETRGAIRNDNMLIALDRLVAIGPEAVPYLVNELEQAQPDTFFFAAYALGSIGTDEAEQAVRSAIEKAESEPGDWADLRKGWVCWALGLLGRADAIDLAYEGRHLAGHVPIHGNFTVVESVTLLTAPEGVDHALRQLERFNDDNDPYYSERTILLAALGYPGGEKARDALSGVLKNEPPAMRRQAAYSIGRIDDPESVSALLAALDDPDIRVRRAAAIALYDALPVDRLEIPLAKLESENNPVERGALYRVVARAGGPAYTDRLLSQWGRDDATDRMQLVQVLPQLDPAKVLPTLRQAMVDPDALVFVAAAIALGELGGEEALELLLGAVPSPYWTLAGTAVDQLVRLHETRAAVPIASRLIDVEMKRTVTDPRQRMRIEALGDALLALGGTPRIDELREAAARQKDGELVQYLDRLIPRIEAVHQNGTKFKKWVETLQSPDPALRMAAYDYLGHTGNVRAAPLLVEQFGRADTDEAGAILNALGSLDCEASRALIERVLTGPEFDSAEHRELRDRAAWSARRLGGASMYAALQASVERRDGRDVFPLIYLAVLGGADAIPQLDRYRIDRMRYITWRRGKELRKLDWIRRELAHGRPLGPVDVPPDQLEF